jgi:hypothetical protein
MPPSTRDEYALLPRGLWSLMLTPLQLLQVLDRAFTGLEVGRETVETFIARTESLGSEVPRSQTSSTWLTRADTISVWALYEHCAPDRGPTTETVCSMRCPGGLSNITQDVQSDGFDSRCTTLLDFIQHPSLGMDDISATNIAESLCESWWTGSITYTEVSLGIYRA